MDIGRQTAEALRTGACVSVLCMTVILPEGRIFLCPKGGLAMKKYFAERFKEKYKSKFGDFSDESFLIIPSFVDVHVHLREPGFFFKETIASGSRAAAASGSARRGQLFI